MSFKNDVSKSVWNLMSAAKDNAAANIVKAISSGQLKVDDQAARTIIMILKSSVDETYQKGLKSFVKSVEHTTEQNLVQTEPIVKPLKSVPTKKK